MVANDYTTGHANAMAVTEYPFHPIAGIFPLLPDAELQELADDIKAHGLNHAISLFDNQILDGRNRALACDRAGVPRKYEVFRGTYQEAIDWVWSENMRRRQLTSSQMAAAEVNRNEVETNYAAMVQRLAAEAHARQRESVPKAGQKGFQKQSQSDVTQLIESPQTDRNERSTTAKRAKLSGTNRQYVADAETIKRKAPEKFQAIERGEKTIPQAKREMKQAEVKQRLMDFPGEKYRVLYADPPWKYSSGSSGLDQYGPAERHYPAMTIAELCALDVKACVEEDAVLFLWVTSPLLAECWPVIKAWGFEYKTSFVWDKVLHNFGHYNSVRHEFLLVCTRGSCTPDVSTLIDSVQSIERSAHHSEKPEAFRQIIDTLYSHGKRLELFARHTTPNWATWGNEVEERVNA